MLRSVRAPTRRVQLYLREDVPEELGFLQQFAGHPRRQEWAREVIRAGLRALADGERVPVTATHAPNPPRDPGPARPATASDEATSGPAGPKGEVGFDRPQARRPPAKIGNLM